MILHLNVKPDSKVDSLFYDEAGQLCAKIKAPAQDGKANAYLSEFLGKTFGIPRSAVTLRAGFTNSHKKLEIDGDEAALRAVLEELK